jgi:hypothetical protein
MSGNLQIKAAGMVAGMGDADLLHAAMHRTGDFGLLRFLPAATLAVASAAAGPERCAAPHARDGPPGQCSACTLLVAP